VATGAPGKVQRTRGRTHHKIKTEGPKSGFHQAPRTENVWPRFLSCILGLDEWKGGGIESVNTPGDATAGILETWSRSQKSYVSLRVMKALGGVPNGQKLDYPIVVFPKLENFCGKAGKRISGDVNGGQQN